MCLVLWSREGTDRGEARREPRCCKTGAWCRQGTFDQLPRAVGTRDWFSFDETVSAYGNKSISSLSDAAEPLVSQ